MLIRTALALLTLSTGLLAQAPTERRLADQAPLLKLETARQGLAIDGSVEWWDDFYVTYEVRTRPRTASMTLRCEVDGTPLLLCLNDSALLYDVPAARYVWLRGAVLKFTFEQTEDGPELHATVFPRSRGRREHEIDVDLRSIFLAENVTLKAEQTADEEYLLIAMDDENEAMNAAALHMGRKPPFVHYECSAFETERPWIVISRMDTNVQVPDAIGASLTAEDLRARGIEVIEHPAGSWSHGLVSEIMDGWYFLHAMRDAPTRTRMEGFYGRVGWHQLRRAHERIRGVMQELTGAPPPDPEQSPTTQPEGEDD